jgi:threonine synthase
MTQSYLSHLECSGCCKQYPHEKIHTFCPLCQSPLLSIYDLKRAHHSVDRDEITRRKKGMWRWHELLPVLHEENQVFLGEGDTPLLTLPRLGKELGLSNLYAKDESSNPTGSFKARGLAAAISKAKELGVKKVIIPTAGNAGGAMAAYAARAGLRAHIFMPKDTPFANVEESRMAGADVILIDGIISDAAGLAGEKARAEGWFDVSTFKEPYRTEGKKVMGYELAEAFHWQLPDVIVYPTGGGTGLVGMWKAFEELEAIGWMSPQRRPRMVSVQAEGCAPIVRAFKEGTQRAAAWESAATVADGLRVPRAVGDFLILRAVRESGGTALSVPDAAMIDGMMTMGSLEWISAAPEGGAAWAALVALVEQGIIHSADAVVLFNTGGALKYLDLLN